MPRPASVTWRVLLAAALYALFGALVSHGFTRLTGLSRWTLLPGGPSQYFSALLSINLINWFGWCLLAAAVFALGRRVRFDREGWWQALAFHAVASIAITTAHLVLTATGRVWLQDWYGGDPLWWPSVRDAILRQLDQELPVYWALLGLQHAVDYRSEIRTRELKEAELRTKLVEAQLSALQQQLHPHFLFNTLHAISTLVHRDPDKADAMIERLSDLLRITLSKVGVQEVALAEELEYLRAYLDIEQVHFGDRLKIAYRVDAVALDAMVPTMILQPLAENAIRHGLEPRLGGGVLAVEAAREHDTLRIRIVDTGRGLAGTRIVREGVGLSNTRARLDRLYGAEASVTLRDNPGGGAVTEIVLPFRQGPVEQLREEVA
jgi:two-component system LytT family sensor kinase